uniref:Uncharacterized protein n=1 Tax=Knipowitschia caucasica TaxID=637954 RepID=A0AAV2KKE0_KNICA
MPAEMEMSHFLLSGTNVSLLPPNGGGPSVPPRKTQTRGNEMEEELTPTPAGARSTPRASGPTFSIDSRNDRAVYVWGTGGQEDRWIWSWSQVSDTVQG